MKLKRATICCSYDYEGLATGVAQSLPDATMQNSHKKWAEFSQAPPSHGAWVTRVRSFIWILPNRRRTLTGLPVRGWAQDRPNPRGDDVVAGAEA